MVRFCSGVDNNAITQVYLAAQPMGFERQLHGDWLKRELRPMKLLRVTGHSNITEVSVYTREAENRRLAMQGMNKVASVFQDQPIYCRISE